MDSTPGRRVRGLVVVRPQEDRLGIRDSQNEDKLLDRIESVSNLPLD